MYKSILKFLVAFSLGLMVFMLGQTEQASAYSYSFKSARLIKMSNTPLVKPVKVISGPIYYMVYSNGKPGRGGEPGMVYSKKDFVMRKFYNAKKYSNRMFYLYKTATFKINGKRKVYYLVGDSKGSITGWIHRSNAKKITGNRGQMKQIKAIYNIIQRNAAPATIKHTKSIFATINPGYPYRSSGGVGTIMVTSGLSDLIYPLFKDMYHPSHDRMVPDVNTVLKNAKAVNLIYDYYQKRASIEIVLPDERQYFKEHTKNAAAVNAIPIGDTSPDYAIQPYLERYISQLALGRR